MKESRTLLFWFSLLAMGVTVASGLILNTTNFRGPFARFSYDLPFLFRSEPPSDLVMVYLDSRIKKELAGDKDRVSRRYHARLMERLRRDGARIVYFDMLFDEPTDAADDAAFAEAVRKNGRVVLVADLVDAIQLNSRAKTVVPPIDILRTNAAGWGVASLLLEPDFAIRRIHPGTEDVPSADWVAARFLEGRAAERDVGRAENRWLNYYGPPGDLLSVNYDQAISASDLPAGFFRDKVVVIGTRPDPGPIGSQRDEFANPYFRFGSHLGLQGRFSAGPDIHATGIYNLLRKDWLRALSPLGETLFLIGYGSCLGFLLMHYKPGKATVMAALCLVLLTVAGIVSQLINHIWWNWSLPVAVQTPLAYAFCLGFHYGTESRKRRQLRRAFSVYLSPYMAERISNRNFDLSLGGTVVPATIMFTDLEGFTTLTEKMNPMVLSTTLTDYFNRTSKAVLDEDGTIIKFIGDAVLAVWGAPLEVSNRSDRAVRAACEMLKSNHAPIAGKRLKTRVGIHTGEVLAGNLGSEFRFDYTVMGDTVNFASRLESLNKQLGTEVLISEQVKSELTIDVRLREMGSFVVAGRTEAEVVWEVLGLMEDTISWANAIAAFGEALKAFKAGDFKAAETGFRMVLDLRDGEDGPSDFYLREIERVRQEAASSWDGIVRLREK